MLGAAGFLSEVVLCDLCSSCPMAVWLDGAAWERASRAVRDVRLGVRDLPLVDKGSAAHVE